MFSNFASTTDYAAK